MDALESADQEIFESHRPGCAVCARTVVATLEVAAELAYGVPDIAPPVRLRSRLLPGAAPRAARRAAGPPRQLLGLRAGGRQGVRRPGPDAVAGRRSRTGVARDRAGRW